KEAEERRRLEDELRAREEEARKLAEKLRDRLRQAEDERRKLDADLRAAREAAETRTRDLLDQLKAAEASRAAAEATVRKLETDLRIAQEDLKRYQYTRERKGVDVVCVLKALDAKKNTVSVTLRGTKLAVEMIPISKGARFTQGGKACELGDLKLG